MIVVDDFIKDSWILHAFSDVEMWQTLCDKGFGNYWNGQDILEYEGLKDVILEVYSTYWNKIQYTKFEYWVNITDARRVLEWHVDKDEEIAEKEERLVSPKIGAVWYGCPQRVSGGYLEIANQYENGEYDIERIEPVYNRLVIFDVSKTHRVAPIFEGTRYGLQINLW